MVISCTCIYQIGHANVVRHDDFSSSLRLWYLELESIRERYLTLIKFGKISLSVSPLWTGHMRAWFSLARYRHSLTFPLDLGTSTKPLHHSTVLSTPSGVIMSCCWIHSNSSLKGLVWFAVWFYLQWKHSIKTSCSTKMSLKYLCSHFMISVPAVLP